MSTGAGVVVMAVIFAFGVVVVTAGVVSLLPAALELWSRFEGLRRREGS